MNLGKLKGLDLRAVWQHEENDFTPWLEENIDLLAEALGLEGDLEVESREEQIGRYRADLICSSQAGKVLVENQLGETDHSHLGQVLAYAAGVEATVIVWVAASFTEEHRATIDWLNSITDGIDFFGLEIELWQIGNSDPAPKFNIVSKPNDWSRSVAAQARELTPLGQMQLEYWTKFREVLLASNGSAKASKPAARHWFGVPTGRGGFNLAAIADTRGARIRAEMYIEIANSIRYFDALRKDGGDIESDLGFPLDWQPLHGKKACRIAITEDLDPKDKSTWLEQHRWLADRLNRMHAVLAPRVSKLEPVAKKPRRQRGRLNERGVPRRQRPPACAGSEGEGPSEAVGKRRPMLLQKPTPNRSAADRSERSPFNHPISATVRWNPALRTRRRRVQRPSLTDPNRGSYDPQRVGLSEGTDP